MKFTWKLGLVFVGLTTLLLVSWGCGNGGCATDADCGGSRCVNGACAQCVSDGDCNANDACMVCSGSVCQKKSQCCTTDLQCGSGMRCWNVPGKAYGTCGAKNR